MENKTKRNPAILGALWSVLLLAVVAIADQLPAVISPKQLWTTGLFIVAAVVVIFVVSMHKKVTRLKKN